MGCLHKSSRLSPGLLAYRRYRVSGPGGARRDPERQCARCAFSKSCLFQFNTSFHLRNGACTHAVTHAISHAITLALAMTHAMTHARAHARPPCTHACTQARTHARTHACTARTHARAHSHMHTYACVPRPTGLLYVNKSVWHTCTQDITSDTVNPNSATKKTFSPHAYTPPARAPVIRSLVDAGNLKPKIAAAALQPYVYETMTPAFASKVIYAAKLNLGGEDLPLSCQEVPALCKLYEEAGHFCTYLTAPP